MSSQNTTTPAMPATIDAREPIADAIKGAVEHFTGKGVPIAIDEVLEDYRTGAIDYAEQRARLDNIARTDATAHAYIQKHLLWTQQQGNNEVGWM